MVPAVSDATYSQGQAAASGDDPVRVRYEASAPTPEGIALRDELAREDPQTRAKVRASLVALGWRRIARVRPEDAHELGPIMRRLITTHRSPL